MQEQPQKPTSNIANDSFPGLGDRGARLGGDAGTSRPEKSFGSAPRDRIKGRSGLGFLAAGADGTLEIPSFDRHDFRYLLRVVEVNVLTAISLNL